MGFISRNYRRPTFMWTYAALSWLVIIVGCRPLNSNPLRVTLTVIGNLEYGDMVEVWCPYPKEMKPVFLTLIAASKSDWKELGSLTCYFLDKTGNGTGVFEQLSSKDATLCQSGLNSSTGIVLSTEDPLPELVLTGMIRVVGADVHPSNLPCYVIGEQPPTAADTVSIGHSTCTGLTVAGIILNLIFGATVVYERCYSRCRKWVRHLRRRDKVDSPEANPLLSAGRERWWLEMDIDQLRYTFCRGCIKLVEKLSQPEVEYAATELYSRGMLINEELERLLVLRGTRKGECLIDYIITKNSKKIYCAFLEILQSLYQGELVSLLL